MRAGCKISGLSFNEHNIVSSPSEVAAKIINLTVLLGRLAFRLKTA